MLGKGHDGLYKAPTMEEGRKWNAKRRGRSEGIYWWLKMSSCRIRERKLKAKGSVNCMFLGMNDNLSDRVREVGSETWTGYEMEAKRWYEEGIRRSDFSERNKSLRIATEGHLTLDRFVAIIDNNGSQNNPELLGLPWGGGKYSSLFPCLFCAVHCVHHMIHPGVPGWLRWRQILQRCATSWVLFPFVTLLLLQSKSEM